MCKKLLLFNVILLLLFSYTIQSESSKIKNGEKLCDYINNKREELTNKRIADHMDPVSVEEVAKSIDPSTKNSIKKAKNLNCKESHFANQVVYYVKHGKTIFD